MFLDLSVILVQLSETVLLKVVDRLEPRVLLNDLVDAAVGIDAEDDLLSGRQVSLASLQLHAIVALPWRLFELVLPRSEDPVVLQGLQLALFFAIATENDHLIVTGLQDTGAKSRVKRLVQGDRLPLR